MRRKSRSPEQLARLKPEKKIYSFSLEVVSIARLTEYADSSGVPRSELVDEAIKAYLADLDETKSKQKP